MIVRAPRIELEYHRVVGTETSVHRKERLHAGDRRPVADDPRGPLGQASRQLSEISRLRQLFPASLEIRSDQHGRTPSIAHCTGRIRIPSALAPAIAGAGSSGPRKNMQPPAPEPAALPPSAPAVAHPRLETVHSGVHMAESSACCRLQFSLKSSPTRTRSLVSRASAIRFGDIAQGGEGSGTAESPRSYAVMTRVIVPPENRDAPV